ncbi:Uridine kinase [Atopostipes suicloacalis DSM 15692]|uniref:Uridine kinase n=1 Tax=Atopostipes suicloacalis DSM 15692 TaxID=1121025 RepID=A0A1M4ZP67_9LACT|nr:hypothetical protein [Atopostipes suicloacalis]SHF19781.1 Uridine kinase [Atopostipes suicloacalis DSM 15692]
MNKKSSPFIIAIAGVSGSGKTTITKILVQKLPNAKALYFDDYDFDGPENIIRWVENGSDYNLWDLSPLLKDLEALCIQQLNYIVLDFPFAYKHLKMSDLIDLAVFIDTPLDVALARRMIRDFQDCSTKDILSDMENYILQGRKGYIEMLDTIKPNSDVMIDGTQSILNIVDDICEQLV